MPEDKALKKLAIITTHPIQYNAPFFKLLTERNKIAVKVFYTWGETVLTDKYDPGFGKIIKWDIPLLAGYDYSFVKNIAAKPGSHHFRGVDNPALNEEVKAWGADAILVYGWSFKSHLSSMRYFYKKIPVFFRGDSVIEGGAGILRALIKKTLLTWVYRHTDKAFYAGSRNRQYFLQYGLREDQLIFAPHAIDNNRFSREREGNERQVLNIPADAIVFLFAGKLEPKKNPALLLETFKRLADTHAYLIIAGNGILEEELKKEFGDVPRVIFLPFQNQTKMPALYKMADVFILPSQGPGETWGLAVNEAMASARAVLVSDACGCAPDLVKESVNGYTFKSKDAEDLLAKMKALAADKNMLQSMGKYSADIITDWSYEKDCIAIEETLLKIPLKKR